MDNPDQVGVFAIGRPAASGPVVEAEPRPRPRRGMAMVAVLVAVAGTVPVGSWMARGGFGHRAESSRDLQRQPVSRVDLSTRLTATGRVESAHNTIVLCELERLEIRNEGRVLASGGSSTILDIVAEGTRVKKDDVLCRLDSSEYEELVRTQRMKTEQSRAALEQARLSFDVAELAVREYRDGLVAQNLQELTGAVALAESSQERAADRLRWTQDMLKKGYVPIAQRASAQRSLAEIQLQLQTSRWDLANFRKFGNPMTLKVLQSEVEMRRHEVIANSQRVARLEERLTHYNKMVDHCTIRAPHDGILIYASDPWSRTSEVLEAGVQVREQQKLFFLPDLTRMEVITYLHESVANRVQPGLAARARVEGVANRTLEGRVVSVAPLPISSPVWTTDRDVKYVVAIVRLDAIPDGLLPGMAAEVEIDVDRGDDVLAVPTEAVAIEDGRDICYVAGVDGLHRRRVTLGRSNRDLLEVTGGLAEGEQVIINPAKVEAIDAMLADAGQGSTDDTPSADHHSPAAPVSVE